MNRSRTIHATRTLKKTVGLIAIAAIAPASASAGLTAGPVSYTSLSGVAGPGSGQTLVDSCPDSRQLIGGGGSIAAKGTAPSERDTAVTSVAPYDGADLDPYADDGFRTSGYNATGEVRVVSVTAICLKKDAALTYAKNAGTTSSDEISQAAGCGGGKLLGGGGYVEGPAAVGSAMMRTNPYDDGDPNDLADDGWGYSALRPAGGSSDTAAHAICAAKGDLAVRYPYRIEDAGAKAKVGGPIAGASRVACPRGFHVSGGGAYGDLRIRASVPFDGDDANLAPDDGWRVRFYSPDGAEEPMSIHAICVA
jgi:hypothetical protein